ncbi:hypothetical protein Desaci_4259 [Desulfosporosinus acidiphilus SJ4]|uniref:Uncharacterized protein n=1 Tax=Desulfosporosinus acidiphilus (strain DSM 22704 / JCM 16185 / SJ4) TaxID=646529 RepID=I4DBE0_DESAJ|nr:hypothetical protein [Desulfosporosinus acidiphilus]AFM43114.1 hypothetical protein Desaci_4259 [Desulfosporosinus acidiphilus SJ4]
MADYKEMYSILFNKLTDIIEEIQQVQRRTEEMYMHSKDSKFILLKSCEERTEQLEKPEKNE